MKDGPFQGDLERAVCNASEIELQKEKILEREKGFQGLYLQPDIKRMSTPNTAMEVPAKLVKEIA